MSASDRSATATTTPRRGAKPDPGPPDAPVITEGELAARNFVKACAEIINGHRPAAHLRGLSHPRDAASLISQTTTAVHRIAAARRAVQPTPQRHPPVPVIPVYTNICEPCPGVVEAAAVLVSPERTWALAFRLERSGTRWLAAVMRLL
ncbi:Rv3235 family protein [Actinoplanes sp. N902-109]|uniref:Rv3235 family protein n=1 Tax=Actinoplanes sp. (strain N902-109) TaxID=649831 RepID=UPI0003295729|nr:Rv3235 family protein [Actinoplanes sp. N902-109]AGL14691.1 hypothetical protein L083_1181 [Actinoplanes sp. N902-109]